MRTRVSENQKKEILEAFVNGTNIDDLSEIFNFTVATITRQLKNMIGKQKFLEIKNSKKDIVEGREEIKRVELNDYKLNENKDNDSIFSRNSRSENSEIAEDSFFEVLPLVKDVDFNTQKDLTSVPLSEIKLPDLVFMIVDKNIELDLKYLKELPEWSFLPEEDLNRKIIRIYLDLKNAKRDCRKDQKVIKVPNTNVFKIAAPFLVSRGISRIISENHVISI